MTEAIRKQDELAKNRINYPVRKSYYTRGNFFYSQYFCREKNKYVEEKLFECDEDAYMIVAKKKERYNNVVTKIIIHKKYHPSFYTPTFSEANFTHRLLYLGFTPHCPFDPYSNWFGCSKAFYAGHTPELIFKRGNKKIILSLQGFAMPVPTQGDIPNTEELEGVWTLIEQVAARYIGFFIDEKPAYQTWSGALPDQKFIDGFTYPEKAC